MEIKRDSFNKAGKLISIVIVTMLIIAAFVVVNVGSTDVTNNDAPTAWTKASASYLLVMNFTITTQSDSIIAGTWPADGAILEYSDQSSDWGSESAAGGDMWFYDANENLGSWNSSEDCIFLDNVIDNDRWNTGETVVAGTHPVSGTFGTGRGCKHPTAWKRVKAYDPATGGEWNSATDAIMYEGSDNNSAVHDELKAVTFNLSTSCNATSSDISDLTLWVEASGSGFSASADTLLGNATYSSDSNTWNVSGLSQDINTSATFYVAVNITGSPTNWHAIQMEIPTLSDTSGEGAYNASDDDQGLFLAGTNDTGSITNSNKQTIDTNAPVTSIDTITPYWNTTGSIPITATASDTPSGVANVTLYYRYAADNSTWGTWVTSTIDSSSPYSWTSTCSNGSGYYEFYSRGYDNAGNQEAAPANNDTLSAYDDSEPATVISAPADGANLNSLSNITGTVTDTFSDVASVTITIYNSTDGTYWTGSAWGSSTNLNTNLTADYDDWYYEDTSAFPTWVSGKSYTIASTGTDNATNVESTPDSNSFNYDTSAPTVDSITAPLNNTYYNALTNITGTASDTGGSGISSINITMYNQTGGKYWNGSDWASSAIVWLETNGTTAWYNDSAVPTWTNASTYYINATGTDNAGNVGGTTWNYFTFDDNGLTSEVTDISQYWQTTSPLSVAFTANDPGSGLDTVTLYYRYSSDNSSWGSWTTFGTADSSPWDPTAWSFDFASGAGYYEFYTRATDNASNTEAAPVANDTLCSYDPDAPTGTIVLPVNNGYYKSGSLVDSKINGTVNDPRTVTNAYIEIYNSTGNAYFNGSAWIATYINVSANLSGGPPTTEWIYDNTSAFPTWAHNQTYYVNLSSVDTAGNWNNSTASASFLYDTQNPTTTVTAPTDGQWLNTLANITGTATDDGESGVATVNLTIYNQTGAKYWTGSAWGNPLTNLSVTGTTAWYYTTVPSWTNGSTYLINASSTDNAGNAGSWDSNTLYIDTDDLSSSATAISPYWNTAGTQSVAFTASDVGSGLNDVTLYYRYSNDNSSWGSWTTFGTADSTPWDPTAWSFTFPSGAGYYEFRTVATDNASNTETVSGNDTTCGYDDTNPTGAITIPVNNEYYTAMNSISGTCSDSGYSGIKEVNITIYNVTANKYWDGAAWNVAVSWISTTLAGGYTTWSYTSSSVTWEDGKSYIINATAVDNSTRTSSVDSNTFTLDTTAPAVTIEMNSGTIVKLGDTVKVFANFTEAGSGMDHTTVKVTVDTAGTDVTAQLMNMTDNTHWWYNWDVPSASDGNVNVSVAASDNVSYTLSGTTWNTTKTIDNTAPTVGIAFNISRNYYKDADSVRIFANFTELGSGITSSPQISINYAGGTDLTATGMTETDNTHWYHDLNVPTGAAYDGQFTVNVTATDNASNNLNPNPTTDNSKYIDNTNPTGNIATPTDGGYYDETLTNLSGVVNDTQSLSTTVTITIYNTTGNAYFTGSAWQASSSSLTANTSGSGTQINWWYEDTVAYPTFTDGSNYTINLTGTDTAGNSAQVDGNTFYYDTGGPTIGTVLITDVTISSTTYVKDTDTVNITADVSDANLASGDQAYIKADLTGFGLGSAVVADGYDGTTAYWEKSSVTCTPGNGTVTVTINASDKSGNYATEVTDTITSDNAPPTISYVLMDADNDGTNYSYIDIVFSETTMDHSTIAYTDFNISTSGVDTAQKITSASDLVTLRFDTTFQTGDSPTLGVDGSVADLAGNTLTSGTTTINTFRISLVSGWNLVSLPADADASLISTIVSDIDSNLTIIWHYNASANSWASWTDLGDDGSFRFEPGEAYWFSMSSADTLIGNYNLMPTGPTSPPYFTLTGQAWNLIGHWKTYNQSASTNTYGALASLSDDDVGVVYKYTGASGGSYINIWNGHQTMEPGKGYWLWKESTGSKSYVPS